MTSTECKLSNWILSMVRLSVVTIGSFLGVLAGFWVLTL